MKLGKSQEASSSNMENRLTIDNEKQIFFYEQDFYVFSNFSAFNLRFNGVLFHTSEAAYQYQKFGKFKFARDMILSAPSAHEAFVIAQEFRNERDDGWDNRKVSVMHDILVAKVLQHPYVKKKLIDSGNRELVENSWRDSYWGWGPNRDGQNMLGKIWMQVRDEIKNV